MTVFVVLKHGDKYGFVGVYSTREKAEAACLGPDYFVGPIALDFTSPIEPTPWPDGYYPKMAVEFANGTWSGTEFTPTNTKGGGDE